MKAELDKALCDKYPKIFAERHGNMRDTAMCWGFECGDGWYKILNILCRIVQSRIDLNPHLKFTQPIASQVKEKFGTLRFYTNDSDDFFEGALAYAEAMSAKTCDICGSEGKLDHYNGWYRTRCTAHYVVEPEIPWFWKYEILRKPYRKWMTSKLRQKLRRLTRTY